MLSKFNRNKHQQHLAQLPKLPQSVDAVQTLYCATDFRTTLLDAIANASQRIYLTALYLENDDGGKDILSALYQAKQKRPDLQICVMVDWHRAQRGRIGEGEVVTNADWYCQMAQQHPEVSVPVYGVPVNTREALGVLHLKGSVIDDQVIYSGASLNNVYLHRHDKYRYDRYHLLTNPYLADTMVNYVKNTILNASAVQRLDKADRPKNPEIKNFTKQFRQNLRDSKYQFTGIASSDQLAVTPLVGLGRQNLLNQTIYHLMSCTEQKLTLCTPYFNLPRILVRSIIKLLRAGKQVEIIVGDKTANDFYISPEQPFKIIGALPYLYEINLRRFLMRLQPFIDSQQLIVRLWKDSDNTFHLKGIWVDDAWQLITGNNLNPRAWRLDLENAILIHDPQLSLIAQKQQEQQQIRLHTQVISHYTQLDTLATYPVKVRKLIRRLRRIRVDRLISRLL
jgi:CDP-diacylglycerol--serine O-phosphatidyltransferase